MEKRTVLICDDNESIHTGLQRYLTDEGFEVLSAFDGERALEIVRQKPVHLLLLDIMLPGICGYDVCRELRKQNSNLYIIMLSARDEEVDRVVGMELGADDYIAKPFSPRVVAVRIKKALERLYPTGLAKTLTLAELTVWPESFRVRVRDEAVTLSAKEVEVLIYFLENPGKVLTREHILHTVWNADFVGDERVVDSLIKRLRQKIMRDGVHFAIQSVYGAGYRIEETE